MPFIPASSPQIQIFRNVLDAPVEFPRPEPITDPSSAVPHTDESIAVLTANELAHNAYTLFAERNYRILFDGQPGDTIDFIVRRANGSPPGSSGPVLSQPQRATGASLLDHLALSLSAMNGDAEVSPDKTEHASTVAGLLATPRFWSAEALSMGRTLAQRGIRLDPTPSSTTIRVWKLKDGSGWGMHKVMHWHTYTDIHKNQLRHMDDGSPILTVDKSQEISFDALRRAGGQYLREYCGEARTTLCHVGWADPELDILTAKSDPVTGLPLEQSPLQQFASWLFSILADTFGMKGIRYAALTMPDLEQIIEDRPTIPSVHPVRAPGVSTSMVAGQQCVAVKRQPGKERHYAARHLHDAPNGAICLAVKPDRTTVQIDKDGTEHPSVAAMLCMAKKGNLAVNGLVRASSRAATTPTSTDASSSGVASRHASERPVVADGDDDGDGDISYSGTDSEDEASSRPRMPFEPPRWQPSKRGRSAELVRADSRFGIFDNGHYTNGNGMRNEASPSQDTVGGLHPPEQDMPLIPPPYLETPPLSEKDLARLQQSQWPFPAGS